MRSSQSLAEPTLWTFDVKPGNLAQLKAETVSNQIQRLLPLLQATKKIRIIKQKSHALRSLLGSYAWTGKGLGFEDGFCMTQRALNCD